MSRTPMGPVQGARRLILARHGQSAFNAQNRFTGWRDCALPPPR